MKNKGIKIVLFIFIMIIASVLYSRIEFGDIRDTSAVYFAYGLKENQNIIIVLRWYFFICILFSYLLGHYKNYMSSNKANRIIRYKSRKEYQTLVINKLIIKTVCCWGMMIIASSFFKNNIKMSLSLQDLLVLFSHFQAILSLAILLLILDSKMQSIHAFIIVNGCIVLSFMISNIVDNEFIKLLFFPNLLMGIQFKVHSLLVGLAFISIVNLVLISIYYKITKNADIL